MADWSALVRGFQEGADWSQRRRYIKQLELAREQALKAGGRELYALAGAEQDLLNQFPTETSGMTPYDDSIWELEDPMAVRLKNKFKSWMQKRKKKRQKAIDLGDEGGFNTSNPVGTGEEEYTPAETYALPETDEVEAVPFADGGDIANAMETARGVTQSFATQAGQAPVMTVQAGGAQPVPSVTGVIDTGRNYADGGSIAEVKDRRKASAKEIARGTNRFDETRASRRRKALDVGPKESAYSRANRAIGEFMQTRPLPQEGRTGLARLARGARNLGRKVKGAGALGALGATALEAFNTPTEQFRERFGLETDNPSLPGDIGVRALGAASVLGDVLTLGAAGRLYRDKQRIAAEQQQAAGATPQRAQAIPVEQSPAVVGAMTVTGRRQQGIPTQQTDTDLDVVDFSNIDIDARDVPDMTTDDWKQYRAMVIRDAARRGLPIDQVQDRITQMQQKGFLHYGRQGLALQLAGNIRGAMAAYRAAYQYFPNGNDVEFGVWRDKRTGRQHIIGFAKDEKTGKIVPGSEMVMDPERVSVILDNFENLQAFRLWKKDEREFQQELRKYEEVTKPLAQAQADYMATNSEANVLRAENAALRARGSGGYSAADMRGDAATFRNAPGISELMLTEPDTAQYLLSVMGQIKAANPNVPPDTIATVVMQSYADGTLEQRLQRMGIQ